MLFDFHLHTTFSDGTLPAAAVLEIVRDAGIGCCAITDHDSMSAFDHWGNQSSFDGLRLIAGVEINTNSSVEALHILGFGGKLALNAPFQQKLALYRQARGQRIRAMVEKINALGIALTIDEVLEKTRESVGRPAIADVMREKGIVQSRDEAFARFLSQGKPGYIEPMGPSPEEAVRSIVDAGGVAVVAHPVIAKIDDKKLSSLVAIGLRGVEAYYPTHSDKDVRFYLEVARKFGIFVTCGSDYHGPKTGNEKLTPYDFDPDEFEKFLAAVG